MMFETSKHVPKTEKCCVFKDNCCLCAIKTVWKSYFIDYVKKCFNVNRKVKTLDHAYAFLSNIELLLVWEMIPMHKQINCLIMTLRFW